MQNFIKSLVAFILVLLVMIDIHAQKLDHVLGEVLVEVRNDNGLNNLLRDLSSDAETRSSLVAKQIMSQPMNLWVLKINQNEVNELDFLDKVIKNNHVLLAQQNHITQLRETIPNDPLFGNQWQFINTGQSGGVVNADLDLDLAWDVATGGLTVNGDTIVVCVIDDGINPAHPDLGNNLWINHQEIEDNGIDDDGNGYIDDVRGWSAYADSDDVYVGGGHGTPVAGVIGAKGNNEIGVSGVNWDVKLMIVRGGSPESTALASYAYPYAMRKMYNETNGEKGAFVVSTNASWGVDFGSPEDAPIWCDFYNMLGEVGILNFGATINGNTNVDVEGDLPTACESNFLVSVTNLNRQDTKVTGAGYGVRSIDLGAFGEQTYTLTSGAYGGFGGTSGATPHVAGTAALLYSTDCQDFMTLAKTNPAQAALVVKDCILHGVVPNESLMGITTTGGRLNANNAIQNLISTCGDCAQALGGDVGGITDKNGRLTWFDNGNLGSTSIRYKSIDDIEWVEVENVESGFEFDGLIACTTYEYQTKTICTGNPDADYTYSRVFKTDGCCETPIGVIIMVENQNAIVQWEDILAATNFVVEYRNVTDIDWITVNIGENNTFILGGILDCEFYEVRVKSECAATSNESEFTEIYNINGECDGCTMDFCAFGNKNVSDEWINSVEIENVFVNTSGVNENGLGNYLGQFEINLTKDKTYTIKLAPAYSGSTFDEYFSAYIDYNQNGEFDENEVIYQSSESTQNEVSGTFTIPSDAVIGVSRMRIIMRFNNPNGPCDDSGFEYGEVEEYCVNIVASTTCPTSISAIITDTTQTSLTFELAQNDLISTYILLYKEKDEQDYITVSSSSNIIEITELTKCTFYEYLTGFICNDETTIGTDMLEIRTKCGLSTTGKFENIAFNIYPNPSFSDLIIDFGEPIKSGGTIELISSQGKQIMQNSIFQTGDESIYIEGSEIPTGVYFIKVKVEDKFMVKKWVKY